MLDSHSYQIEIHGLKLYGYHGVYLEEAKLGQTFQIDLTLTVARSATDDLPESVLSYADVIDRMTKTFSDRSYKLIETLGEKILRDLASFHQIQHARIHVKKLHAPIPQAVSHVGVIFERSY